MKTLILAGGVGKSLFPLSREQYPKQFLKFNRYSLFQMAVKRALKITSPMKTYVVTSNSQKFMVLDQLSEINADIELLLEPEPRGTLPAVYFGIKETDAKKVLVMPSDQIIENGEYLKLLRESEGLCKDYLVAFGVKAKEANPNYGYIKPGKAISGGYTIDRFVEKPEDAAALVSEGYLWNTGTYIFNSKLFIEECERFCPDVGMAFEKGVDFAYSALPRLSLDKEIMEKTRRGAVVQMDAAWNDAGSFDAIYELLQKDSNGNAIRGEFISVDSKNNVVIGDRLIATVGLEDTVVVETRDVILVCPRKEATKVREVVKILKGVNDKRIESHVTVYRPWGSYTVLEEGPAYKVKRITVKPGKRLSLQMHYHRSEHWVVVRGTARVTVGDREFILRNGESTFVPAGTKHRLENPGLIPLDIIEAQIGEYIEEDDIVRFDDDFGREKS